MSTSVATEFRKLPAPPDLLKAPKFDASDPANAPALRDAALVTVAPQHFVVFRPERPKPMRYHDLSRMTKPSWTRLAALLFGRCWDNASIDGQGNLVYCTAAPAEFFEDDFETEADLNA